MTIVQQIERIPAVLQAAAEAEQLIRLGIPPGLPHRWFKAFRAALDQSAPHLELSLHEATSEQQRRRLQQGTIDIGLIHLQPPELHSQLVLTQQFGCAAPPTSPLANRQRITWHDLDGLRVMAHSRQENPREEVQLQAAADAAGVQITWILRSFSEHSALIADSVDAQAVMMSEASARRHFPTWRWLPMDRAHDIDAAVNTWAVWLDPDLHGLPEVRGAMAAATTHTRRFYPVAGVMQTW
ncbi:LysR substrate-binding domain-containing protein [Nocardia transvalensis]|uniref:LysR substrate-binding domain-containing protein n=1 Tax=Nocardia transvalensis TaxID=37333 RepID=UPI001893F54E|nr:LysR substrate-binding domain-containing protein [Nocardia transvalensis]MBF6334164.1 LysR family transcriptional regulator [Nocardia transvalensis]